MAERRKQNQNCRKFSKKAQLKMHSFPFMKRCLPSWIMVFVKRKQSRFFEEKLANLQPNEAIVQVHLSENYRAHDKESVSVAMDKECRLQLHVFSDASEIGYGASTYLRIIDPDDSLHCSFVMEKVTKCSHQVH